MLKKILIAIGLLIVLFVVAVAATVIVAPTDCAVEREVVINKPRAEVFEYVKYVKNQNEWGPWFKKDPGMKQDFRGMDGEVGFVSHWVGNTDESGEGEQEIKRVLPNERLDTELRFKTPFESKADAYLITEDAGDNKTKVKWGFTTEFPRPMNVFLVVTDIDAMLGKDYEEGLSSLKTILESR
jgi:uncharacterized protein YndB with AHSA1/START domain